MQSGGLGDGIVDYGGWRRALAEAVREYSGWLAGSGLEDVAPRLLPRLEGIVRRLDDERTTLAVVAGCSRGKSELINAVLFAEYGRRVLPSGASRTTMCPTELLYDPTRTPSIRLLPIESRLRDEPLHELRQRSGEWHEIPIRPGDRESISGAFDAVRETIRVQPGQAAAMGLTGETAGARPDASGMVEVPRWRHAIVNFPDPLLEMGLVVIDTPGLDAIGSEPELTLNMIPNADAILFVLAADTGVCAPDIDVWRRHVVPNHRCGRFVALNKIDVHWDDLRDADEIDAGIEGQRARVAATLGVPLASVFPVSAQNGLVARVRHDQALLRRSGLQELERALAREIVPRQRTLMRERVRRDFDDIHALVAGVLSARLSDISAPLEELEALRGRKRATVQRLAVRLKAERADFDQAVRHLQGLRSMVARHLQTIQATVGLDALREHVRVARDAMGASRFSIGLRDAMLGLVAQARTDFDEVGRVAAEIHSMMVSIQETFARDHGVVLGPPGEFPSARFAAELAKIERLFRRSFGIPSLVTIEKWALMRRFFDTVAAHLRAVYLLLNNEVGGWMRELLVPIESHVSERQDQLMQRFESLRRINEAVEGLDQRIAEIASGRDAATRLAQASAQRVAAILSLLDAPVPEATCPVSAVDAGARTASPASGGSPPEPGQAPVAPKGSSIGPTAPWSPDGFPGAGGVAAS